MGVRTGTLCTAPTVQIILTSTVWRTNNCHIFFSVRPRVSISKTNPISVCFLRPYTSISSHKIKVNDKHLTGIAFFFDFDNSVNLSSTFN